MASQNILYYGSPLPLPQQVPLQAGPLSLIYEAGDLRYIRLGDIEILRRVYSAVRDHNWGTIPPVLTHEQLEVNVNSFRITFSVTNQKGPVDFSWQGEITGEADGTITFTMRGEAHSTFRRNRIGFCVLHPMTLAGVPARIEHTDGTIEESSFPVSIAPQRVIDGHPYPVAPFENLRAVAHPVYPDLWAVVRFEGDTFEMEDQRNWTDASYKIYCTPLALPFPVEIIAGTRITQSIRLSLNGPLSQSLPGAGTSEVKISIMEKDKKPLPKVGLGMASHGQPLTAREIARLKALHLSHLRVDLHLSDPGWQGRLRQAAAEARAMESRLEIALFVSNAAKAELEDLWAALQEIRPPVVHWLVFHQQEKTTSAQWVHLARQVLAKYDPTARVGSGTNAYFTELNANRPPVEASDLITYSLTRRYMPLTTPH